MDNFGKWNALKLIEIEINLFMDRSIIVDCS